MKLWRYWEHIHWEDSGFEGRWVQRPNNARQMRPASYFDNEYYKTFIDRPLWFQKTVAASGKIQWQGMLLSQC